MGAILSPYPIQQFLGDDGEPLAGGLLYSYMAGTDTPLPTYTDSTGTVENENPIELDEYGRAQIWLAEGNGYKLLLTDSEDVTVTGWPIDNINVMKTSSYVDSLVDLKAVTDPFPSSIRMSYRENPNDGGGGWFYLYANSGETPDNGCVVEPDNPPFVGYYWFRENMGYVDPRWYGATADDSTYCTAAFIQAATFAASKNLPLRVFGGTYYLDSTLTISVPVILEPGAVLHINGFALTIRPVIGPNDTTRHFDTSISGSSVGFTEDTTGLAVHKSISAARPEWWYDGSSGIWDTAIQSAINAYSYVELSPGSYKIYSGLYTDRSKCVIRGHNTTLDIYHGTIAGITVGQTSGGAPSSTSDTFSIDGVNFTDSVGGGLNRFGIKFNTVTRMTVMGCRFDNLQAGITSSGIASCANVKVIDCLFNACVYGIDDYVSSAGWMDNFLIDQCSVINLSGYTRIASSGTISNTKFYSNNNSSYQHLHIMSPSNGHAINVIGCKFDSVGASYSSFVYLQDLGSTAVLNLIGCEYYSTATGTLFPVYNGGSTAKWHITAVGVDMAHFVNYSNSDVLGSFLYDAVYKNCSLVLTCKNGATTPLIQNASLNVNKVNTRNDTSEIKDNDYSSMTTSSPDTLVYEKTLSYTTNSGHDAASYRVYGTPSAKTGYISLWTMGSGDTDPVERLRVDKNSLTIFDLHEFFSDRLNMSALDAYVGAAEISGYSHVYFAKDLYYDTANSKWISTDATYRGIKIDLTTDHLQIDSYNPNTNPASGLRTHLDINTDDNEIALYDKTYAAGGIELTTGAELGITEGTNEIMGVSSLVADGYTKSSATVTTNKFVPGTSRVLLTIQYSSLAQENYPNSPPFISDQASGSFEITVNQNYNFNVLWVIINAV